ncbi:hypothetical protein DRN93_02655 [archaeon]|nr:MAG: hypothetical protein DRN93_02655 [archaeon]
MNDKGLTLVELMIAIVIFVVVLMAALSFFSDSYEKIIMGNRYTAGKVALLHAAEIIDRDLIKAGFGMDPDGGDPSPVEWDGTNYELTVRYIDYDKSSPIDCEDEVLNNGKTWTTVSSTCKYEIVYALEGGIKRYVDEGADGNNTSYPMFDSGYVVINSFTASVSTPADTGSAATVSYIIEAEIESKEYKVSGKTICRNWY